ncbi:Methyltransferase domain containing protein [Candidatus Methylopumilus planktonicus]|uniref:class I SAM-dependent methyltransferase n=1 Tax=Candidatus Methylopumilus planktonicus TaxID=1581557 RepID=UPI003BEEF18E
MTDTREREEYQSFTLNKERIATQCVCCGSQYLKSSPAVLMPFVAHRTFDWAPVVIDESWGLATIKSGNAYSICKSLYCNDCGFLFLDIRFSDSELSNLYRDYRGKEYNSLRESYEPGYTKRNDNLNAGIGYIEDIEKFLQPYLNFPITILDWGGDTGKNTPFKNNNEAFDIYDISNKDVLAGARRVSKKEAQSKKYKLIVCSNVLEHVPYPSDLLTDITKAMNNKSVLYIEVPLENVVLNNKSDLHALKKHWHEHINFYSEKSLRLLAQNVGLEVIDLKRLQATAGGQSGYLFQVACRLKSN